MFRLFKNKNYLIHSILNSKNTLTNENLVNNLAYSFSNKSSREIDVKINEERWKNLQNNYKALKTTFGLKFPSKMTKNYPKPNKIYFNL
jgi:hypothetical protein